jgi:hypothetical protein
MPFESLTWPFTKGNDVVLAWWENELLHYLERKKARFQSVCFTELEETGLRRG